MTIVQLRDQFLTYFRSLGYQQLPAATLVPVDDPSVLFTTAGMQQFKACYQQPEMAPAPAVATVQPVMRTSDINEVGDETHRTLFEMLGNFRFGEADSRELKRRSIIEAYTFLTQQLKIEPRRITATVFSGDATVPRDEESVEVWCSLNVPVSFADRQENFWGPTGEEGPCGPTTELYIDKVEVWNLVFNQYYQTRDHRLSLLKKAGLDTGAGLERLVATLERRASFWQIPPFVDWLKRLDHQSSRLGRIIIDHLIAVVFLVSAGIQPANKGREYILRRLIRRAILAAKQATYQPDWPELIREIRSFYHPHYPMAADQAIVEVFLAEQDRFVRTLARATTQVNRLIRLYQQRQPSPQAVSEAAFHLYESFGYPSEEFLAQLSEAGIKLDLHQSYYQDLLAAHQQVSRRGSEKQFKGGLADQSEQTIKHHTAHHLLLAALRQLFGPTVVQKGSNITATRLRLDFAFNRKLTVTELRTIEQLVNDKIKEDLLVSSQRMPREEALRSGALAEFGARYGEEVTVFSIGDFSKELCGGPHVRRTGELGRFRILKEEASALGVRRIKAALS